MEQHQNLLGEVRILQSGNTHLPPFFCIIICDPSGPRSSPGGREGRSLLLLALPPIQRKWESLPFPSSSQILEEREWPFEFFLYCWHQDR